MKTSINTYALALILTLAYLTHCMPMSGQAVIYDEIIPAYLGSGNDYNPSSPGNPGEGGIVVKHKVITSADPSDGGSVSSSFTADEGSQFSVSANPNTGWTVKGWMVDGSWFPSIGNSIQLEMGTRNMSITVCFEYNPVSPGNPGTNYFNPESGEMIIDDFTPGKLSTTIKNKCSDLSSIRSLVIKGRPNSDDLSSINENYYTGLETLDLSRTGGIESLEWYTLACDNVISNLILPSSITSVGWRALWGDMILKSLTIYALIPPVCTHYSALEGLDKETVTIYVPASSIPLYESAEYWKDFTIMPIMSNVHVLRVELPESASNGLYKNCTLEALNMKTGVRQKYVITDRNAYTFNALQKDERYTIMLYTLSGIEIGRIDDVVIPDDDLTVSFENIHELKTVFANVFADGHDVTREVSVEWLKHNTDSSLGYLKKSEVIDELPEGESVVCRVTLGEKLGQKYLNPVDTDYIVKSGGNVCRIDLTPYRGVMLSGKVLNIDGVPISGASVSATQTFNGRYSKTTTSKTDRKGEWSLEVMNTPGVNLIFAAPECVNVANTLSGFDENVDEVNVGETRMRSIVGAKVTYGFTFKSADSESVDSYYSDYQNVTIDVFNKTQNKSYADISLQYPVLAILDEKINPGDQLVLSVKSKTGAFNPFENTVVVDENQRAEVTFDILGKGGISASFDLSENADGVALLYSDYGEFLKKAQFVNAKAAFEKLDDGAYTVVAMNHSDLMNSILRLDSFSEVGFTEGKDYLKAEVQVESGKLSELKFTEIPVLDESSLYYTGVNTGFSANKSSISTGNYLTLRAAIDFKDEYNDRIDNVALVVDLPKACAFVDQSVIQGPNLLPYTLDNNRLTVQLGNNYQSQTRFCVIPTTGGTFNATASIVFDYNGRTITQPIGSAISEIKDIEISVPSVIAGKTFKVSGTALGNSVVKIYEDGTLLGNGKANAAGSWNVECELSNPYNLSTHSIYAEITTPANNRLTTESKTLTYDKNALQVSKVTMYHYNPEIGKTYESVFDFLNPKTTATQWIVYYPKKQFTYTIEFTDNDPERISNVILYVHTADNKIVPLNASYDENKGMWYAKIDMGTSSNGYYPVNCSVDFDYISKAETDDTLLNEDAEELQAKIDDIQQSFDEINDVLDKLDIMMNQSQVDKEEFEELISWFFAKIELICDPLPIPPTPAPEDLDLIDRLNNASNNEERTKIINAERENRNESQTVEYQKINESIKNTLNESIGHQTINGVELPSITIYTVEPICDENTGKINYPNNNYSIISSEENVDKMILQSSSGSKIEVNVNEIVRTHVSSDADYEEWSESTRSSIYDIANIGASAVGTACAAKEVFVDAELARISRQLNFDKVMLRHKLSFEPDSRFVNPNYYKDDIQAIKNNKEALQSATKTKTCVKTISKGVSKLGTGLGVVGVCMDIAEGVSINHQWDALIESIEENCSRSEETVQKLRNKATEHKEWIRDRYVGKGVADVGCAALNAVGLSSASITAGFSLVLNAVSFIGSVGTTIWEHNFSNTNVQNMNDIIREINSYVPDKCDPYPDPNNCRNISGGGANQSGSISDNVQIDPSGYVYEAVPSNRLEGVQASIYYKETKEDMYGDTFDDVVLWDAEAYAQENPMFTDENGMYRWDVPQGLWRVKFEKDGYTTAYSEWLPVPPPQLDVNIELVQSSQPEVIEAHAYKDGIEVQFDKYMDPSTLHSSNIFIIANGEKLKGDVRILDAENANLYPNEEDRDATRYASRVRFVPAVPLSEDIEEIILTVSRNVLSYAGVPMTENFSQTLDIEKEIQVIYSEDVKVLYGSERAITVFAMPAEAAAGRTLYIGKSSDMILSTSVSEVTLDDEGKATIIVHGDLPGTELLTFTIPDVNVVGECLIDVVTVISEAEAPVATLTSGSSLYRGTTVELSTPSDNAIIYYTTDGSCPCIDSESRMVYSSPIVIDKDVTIAAVAMIKGDEESMSDTVTFSYTVKHSSIDYDFQEGWSWISHPFDSELSPSLLSNNANIKIINDGINRWEMSDSGEVTGSLESLVGTNMYKVFAGSDGDIVILDLPLLNPEKEISLNYGWNRLGYPLHYDAQLNNLLNGSEIDVLDVIVGQDGFAQYDGEAWIGTLSMLKAGYGYMYRSETTKNIKFNIVPPNDIRNLVDGYTSSYAPDIHKYADVMPVIATLYSATGNQMCNGEYDLVAFCDSECRGVGSLVNGNFMMNIHGNSGDAILLQAQNKDNGKVYRSTEPIGFEEDVLGSIYEPHPVYMNESTNVDNIYSDLKISVMYMDGKLYISGDGCDSLDVEMYDLAGYKIFKDKIETPKYIDVSSYASGCYIIAIRKGDGLNYFKIEI